MKQIIRMLINPYREVKRMRRDLLKSQLDASMELEDERAHRKELEEALRAFPHFTDSTRITPVGVKIVAKQFMEQVGALTRLLELLNSKQVLTEAKVRKAIGTMREIPEPQRYHYSGDVREPVQGPFIKDDLPRGGD